MEKCWERCGKVCWGVGVRRSVERDVRKCDGEVWKSVLGSGEM